MNARENPEPLSELTPRTLVDPDELHQINRSKLLAAEAAQLQRKLVSPVPSGADAEAYVEYTGRRHAELTKELGPPAAPDRSIGSLRRRLTLAATIAELLDMWRVLRLPRMTEGIAGVPGVPGTSGEIFSNGLYRGGCGFGGAMGDRGTTDPFHEKWWIRNWTCTAVFPPAEEDGHIAYRFEVSTEAHVYHAKGLSGTVKAFVTARTTSDVNRRLGNLIDLGWPVDRDLPISGATSHLGGDVHAEGEIAVRKGKSAALQLTFGVIVGIASGDIHFAWGNFGTRVSRKNLWAGPEHYGKLEYRFAPLDWSRRLDEIVKYADKVELASGESGS